MLWHGGMQLPWAFALSGMTYIRNFPPAARKARKSDAEDDANGREAWRGRQSGRHLGTESDIVPEVTSAQTHPEAGASIPALSASALTKRYGSTVGISNVDLEVWRGERFGFLGPNGAGKTTFIRLALGLLRPSSGRVAVMGFDMAQEPLRATELVGYLPGELGLVGNVSGRLTLDILARLHPRPPELRGELLEVLKLADADLERHVRQYSRGMKQKLGLGRRAAARPAAHDLGRADRRARPRRAGTRYRVA